MDKENMSPISNSGVVKPLNKHRKKIRNKMSSKYLQAIKSKDLSIGAKSYCKLYESAFQQGDEDLNCQRLQLLVLLSRAIFDRFEDLTSIYNDLLDQYRFLISLASAPVSSNPEDNTYQIEEYLHYFRQWFKSFCRCMFSLHLLQEGRSAYPLPKEEETYRCLKDPSASTKQYLTLRSIHSIDSIYVPATFFFSNQVVEAIETMYLRIPTISLDISEKQKHVAGFMLNVRNDLEKVGFSIVKFSVTTLDAWRFVSKTVPIIEVKACGYKVSMGYDSKFSLSGNPFSDTAKFIALQRRSDFLSASLTAKGLGFSTELPDLPPSTPIQVPAENTQMIEPAVSDRNESSLSKVVDSLKRETVVLDLNQLGESVVPGNKTVDEAESPEQRQQVKQDSMWDDYDVASPNKDFEEQQQKLLATIQNQNMDEDIDWDNKSGMEVDIVRQEDAEARRSTRSAENALMDSRRVEELLKQPLEYFTMDQSVTDCYKICRDVVKDSMESMMKNEDTAVACTKAFLRRALHERLLQNKTKAAIKLQISQMFLGLFKESLNNRLSTDLERVHKMTTEEQERIFAKPFKNKLSIWEKHVQKITTRINRMYLNIACSFWDELCEEFFSKNELILNKVLEIHHVPQNNLDPYWSKWKEFKEEIKQESDFFDQFDVIQFAVALKNTSPNEKSHADKKLITQILNIGEKEEDIGFSRFWSSARRYAAASVPPPDYRDASSSTSRKRKSIKNIQQQRTPTKMQKKVDVVSHDVEAAVMPSEVEQPQPAIEKPVEQQLTFDEVLTAFGDCFSNTFAQLGIELTVVYKWATNNNIARRNKLDVALIKLLKNIDQLEDLSMIENAFYDSLPLVMVLSVTKNDMCYHVTPPNGRCYYLLHYQLYRRATDNYQLPMKQLTEYLNSKEEFVEALQSQEALLSAACRECHDIEEFELKTRMQSLVQKIPHVINFETNPDSPPFMSSNPRTVPAAIGSGRWGSPSEGATLFFAPQLSLSMALFHEIEDFYRHCKHLVAHPEKIRDLPTAVDDMPAIFITSTSTVNGPLYCATMKALVDSCEGLNFGMFDGNHFFPIARTETKELFVAKLQQAYTALCQEALKIFKKIDKNELVGDLHQKLNEYRLRNMRGRAVPTNVSGKQVLEDLTTSPLKEAEVVNAKEGIEDVVVEEVEGKVEAVVGEGAVEEVGEEEVGEGAVEEVGEEVEAITVEDFLDALEGDLNDMIYGRKKVTLAEWQEFGKSILQSLKYHRSK